MAGTSPAMTAWGAAVAIITLYINADACPVKQEIYRVAERHATAVDVADDPKLT